MAKIELLDMAFFSHHGCFEEEQLLGTHFLVDVSFDTQDIAAVFTDSLEDALDYSRVYTLVANQMNHPSKLLEHVAGRILQSLSQSFVFDECVVSVSKMAPAVGGQVGRSKVTLKWSEWKQKCGR